MIQVIMALIVLCIVGGVIYLHQYKKKQNDQTEKFNEYMKYIAANVSFNLEKLKNGDLGWRKIGHGKSTIELKRLIPPSKGEEDITLEDIETVYPKVAEGVRSVDSDIEKLQVAATRLADKIEEPVRKYYQQDRHKILENESPETRPMRNWLVNGEDAWMEIQANLVNNKKNLDSKGDPGALYWGYRKAAYEELLNKHGARQLRSLNSLRLETTKKLQHLQKRLVHNIR